MQAWDSYWQNNNPNTPVFSNHLGQSRVEICDFWASVFENLAEKAVVLDVACGAGAVFDAIKNANAYTLYAHDGSPIARSKVLKKYPHASEVSNERLLQYKKPFIEQLVSQFGIEYLDDEHVQGAFDTLLPGGNFAALVHKKSGYIYNKYKAEGEQIQSLLQYDVCARLGELHERSARLQETLTNEAKGIWAQTGLNLSDLLTGPEALYAGSTQLLSNYNKYTTGDVRNWFSGMQKQLQAALDNMMEIVSVAKSEDDVKHMCFLGGIKDNLAIQPLYISSQNEPVAWSVRGKKC